MATEEKVDWRNLPAVDEDERPVIYEGWTPSQTFLKHHDRCDRAAMLYLVYRAGAGSHPLNRGAIWHEVASILTRLAIREGEYRVGSPEVAKDELRAYMTANPNLQVSAIERDSLRAMMYNFALGEYWTPEKVIAVETTVTVEIGGFRIICRIDRAETTQPRTLRIIDYKTSYSMADSDEFKGESFDDEGEPRFAGDFQTLIYAVALAFGVLDDGDSLNGLYDRFELCLRYPRYLKDGRLAERSVTVTTKQLLDFKFDLEDQLQRLREVNFGEGKWQPLPGSHCRECPAEYACPLPRILRPESQHAELDSIVDLEAAAVASSFMAKRATNLKARVKKAAERIAEENPEALDLGDGDVGVRIGRDLAFVFLPKESETITDKVALAEAVERAQRYGETFDMQDFVKRSEWTEFAKRKVPPKRMRFTEVIDEEEGK